MRANLQARLLVWLALIGDDEARGHVLLSSQGLFCFPDPLCWPITTLLIIFHFLCVLWVKLSAFENEVGYSRFPVLCRVEMALWMAASVNCSLWLCVFLILLFNLCVHIYQRGAFQDLKKVPTGRLFSLRLCVHIYVYTLCVPEGSVSGFKNLKILKKSRRRRTFFPPVFTETRVFQRFFLEG